MGYFYDPSADILSDRCKKCKCVGANAHCFESELNCTDEPHLSIPLDENFSVADSVCVHG